MKGCRGASQTNSCFSAVWQGHLRWGCWRPLARHHAWIKQAAQGCVQVTLGCLWGWRDHRLLWPLLCSLSQGGSPTLQQDGSSHAQLVPLRLPPHTGGQHTVSFLHALLRQQCAAARSSRLLFSQPTCMCCRPQPSWQPSSGLVPICRHLFYTQKSTQCCSCTSVVPTAGRIASLALLAVLLLTGPGCSWPSLLQEHVTAMCPACPQALWQYGDLIKKNHIVREESKFTVIPGLTRSLHAGLARCSPTLGPEEQQLALNLLCQNARCILTFCKIRGINYILTAQTLLFLWQKGKKYCIFP